MPRAVFVFESEDLSVFSSIKDALGHVEAIDVDNGEYDFFTEDGTVLLGRTNKQEVSLSETDERRPNELRARLRLYLSHPQVDLDPALADDPVAAAQTILNNRWAQRSFQRFPWLDRRANGTTPPVV